MGSKTFTRAERFFRCSAPRSLRSEARTNAAAAQFEKLHAAKPQRPLRLRVVFSVSVPWQRENARWHARQPRTNFRWLRLMPYFDRRADDASNKNRASRLHGLSRRERDGLRGCWNGAEFRGIRRGKRKSARSAAKSNLQVSLCIAGRDVREMACGVLRLREVSQSRRSARRAGNLRRGRMPREGSPRFLDEHDDAHRPALGRGALQQRRLSDEGHAFWRKLRSRWPSAGHQVISGSDSGGNAHRGRSAGTFPAEPLGNLPARKYSARLRTRRRKKSRAWQSES